MSIAILCASYLWYGVRYRLAHIISSPASLLIIGAGVVLFPTTWPGRLCDESEDDEQDHRRREARAPGSRSAAGSGRRRVGAGDASLGDARRPAGRLRSDGLCDGSDYPVSIELLILLLLPLLYYYCTTTITTTTNTTTITNTKTATTTNTSTTPTTTTYT